jgi:hypothetical protein
MVLAPRYGGVWQPLFSLPLSGLTPVQAPGLAEAGPLESDMSQDSATQTLTSSSCNRALVSSPMRAPNKQAMSSPSKADLVLRKLRGAKGATLGQPVDLTGWPPHSVRSFLSGTVRTKRGLNLVSEIGKNGTRRYRVINVDAAS